MITSSQFVERWSKEVLPKESSPSDARLCIAAREKLAMLSLTPVCAQFLAEAGLPDSCAPFLTFEEVEKGLPRLWEVYSPGQWSEKQKNRVAPYVMIGGDGSGSAVCLDETAACRVVLIDHELLFESPPFWRRRQMLCGTLVNSSVPQLAESLLAYALFVQKLLAAGSSVIEDEIPPEPVKLLEAELGRIDEEATAKGAFWFYELEDLRCRAT
jgi:hypothetical protein